MEHKYLALETWWITFMMMAEVSGIRSTKITCSTTQLHIIITPKDESMLEHFFKHSVPSFFCANINYDDAG